MDAGLLDTLVKLASLGASGVAIFAIFWSGWLTMRLPKDASPERHKTLRFYTVVCAVIAMISAVSGIMNAKFNADAIEKVEEEKASVETEYRTFRADAEQRIRVFEAERVKNREIADSLEVILNEKEVLALEDRRDPTVQASIRMLKNSVERLRGGG